MTRPVLLIALGGTISMQGGGGSGITPKLSGDDLVAAVPGLDQVCDISAVSPFRIPGASLNITHIAEVARLINAAEQDYAGFVVVQGTDTIEETAFLLDCLVSSSRPVVVTGAMRGADAAGADGPANILSAATYAASEVGRGLGAVVIFSDEIHSARLARKADTGLTSAFTSAPYGPIGRVSEGKVLLALKPAHGPLSLPFPTSAIPEVAIVSIGFGDSGRSLGGLDQNGISAVVIQGLGAGHVPEMLSERISELAGAMPVVLATRVVNGPVFENTYGFKGSEIDLIGKGVIPSRSLGAVKARLMLQVLIAGGADHDHVRALFSQM
ncbi:asparaginase [Pelagibacterium nitratireducens]|uniref:Asparaginase n=1 Tax=Pelagibacterium nitratireducens TaxID=1046114 RepID=A0ABZ2I2P8_9HYPH|tara:strand:+ start:48866 stop:49843 length:978 start_codon:yes stop_codon:yes gene_type:complete